MKITDVILIEVTGEFAVDEIQSEERIANPLDSYPEFGSLGWTGPAHRTGDVVEHRDVYLEVHTDERVTGLFGPVDGPHGAHAAAYGFFSMLFLNASFVIPTLF